VGASLGSDGSGISRRAEAEFDAKTRQPRRMRKPKLQADAAKMHADFERDGTKLQQDMDAAGQKLDAAADRLDAGYRESGKAKAKADLERSAPS